VQNKVQARIGRSQAQNIENSLADLKLGRYDARPRWLLATGLCPAKPGVIGLKAPDQAAEKLHVKSAA